jgi:D-beta-D-heptose 7-phosphate kinase/D-beta-D-heptose 1-phosphate adenosyltransferase
MSFQAADDLQKTVAGIKSRRVLVLGDAILDEYLHGNCGRISPEAPVPVVRVTHSRGVLGGAANTAANIVSLEGRATLIALVGNDADGAALRARAEQAGVDLVGIDHGRATLKKTRVVGQQQQMMRLDYEDVRPLQPAVEDAVLEAADSAIGACDIVVISDYAKGLLSERVAQAVIQRAHRTGRSVIIDPRPQNRRCYIGCDYVTPNWKEARALLGLPDVDPAPAIVLETVRAIAAALEANVMLTMGPHGITFCGRDGELFSQPTLAREVFDVSGAGDTVVAAFALARAAGVEHRSAVAFANRAASVVVGKFGTATVTPAEIFGNGEASRLIDRNGLAPLVATLRAKGRRIVTVNGSFDLLHSGHLHILREARECGDVLIVGVNSDASVRAYKDANRPIISDRQRAEMLLALRMVDYVHIFDELDPIAFLEEVRPDVHVNGAEYGENCVESETVRRNGGSLHLVNRVEGLSTSKLLDALAAGTPKR